MPSLTPKPTLYSTNPRYCCGTGEDRDFARELVALFIKTGGDTLWALTHCGTDSDAVRRACAHPQRIGGLRLRERRRGLRGES